MALRHFQLCTFLQMTADILFTSRHQLRITGIRTPLIFVPQDIICTEQTLGSTPGLLQGGELYNLQGQHIIPCVVFIEFWNLLPAEELSM